MRRDHSLEERHDEPGGDALSAESGRPDALDVYWRPGCPFCALLFSSLDRAHVVVRRHNIWEDDDARGFVRTHNRGNETVPTVRLGEIVETNPPPAVLIALIESRFPELIDES
jgi:glutaredoxin